MSPTITATASSSSDALSAGSIAGIVIGSVLGCVLLAVLVFYLLRRYKRHKFTRVANPAHDPFSNPAGSNDLNSQSAKHLTRHSKTLSVTSEPLISPLSWPPIPSTSRIHSSLTPPRSESLSPAIRDSKYSPAKTSQVIASGTVSQTPAPCILNIPPARKPEQVPSSPKSQQSFFIHRMLQPRADSVSLVHRPSLGFVQGSTSTRGSSIMDADQEHLLADAECRGAQAVQREERMKMHAGEVEDREEVASSESMYSQPSASLNHPSLSDSLSRRNSSLTAQRRKSPWRQPRTTELVPVLEGRSDSRPVSVAANSSLDGQISHATVSRSMSSVVDQSGTLPLLTSVNFGKGSTTSGTTAGSMSSRVWGSNSSSRTSRYPSLAPSSIGLSSQPVPRSDGDTDWRHPPPGLSGLKTLEIGPLRSPYSPVEERPVQPAPVNRARLRDGTASSIPEVERMTVMPSGIAHIDVTL